MGLNIKAYGRLKLIPYEEVEFGSYGLPSDDRVRSFFSNPDYPYHIEDIDPEAFYLCRDKFEFRAGSYAGYNNFRNELAKLAGYDDSLDVWNNKYQGPFVELINFSDCAGTIGFKIASKLLHDFKDFEGHAKLNVDPFFYESYRNWMRACEMASKAGAISFN